MRFQSIVGKEGTARRLLPALVYSAILHFLLLWTDPPRLTGQAASLPLAATLRATPAHPVPPVQQVHDAPRRSSAAGATFARPVPAGKDAAASPAEQAAAASEREPVVAGAKETATAPVAPAAGPDAEGIRAYRIGLAREARNHRRYPQLAQERGWTGTAEVEVDVTRQGRARHVLLARSSGHDILDREALDMMTRAASAAALPPSLRGQAFSVRLPVEFELSD